MLDLQRFGVVSNPKFSLAQHDPGASPGSKNRPQANAVLRKLKKELIELQQRLYANGEHGLVLVLQALDAGGKDGTIRTVLSGLNPQGVNVTSFKAPSAVESRHDYLWRIHQAVPARGQFTVFNRSHYEDVAVVRVHQEQFLPEWARRRKRLWPERFEQINNFEKALTQNNIYLVKVFLNISREEQQQRMGKRLRNPAKNWKFCPADLAESERWDDYQSAFEQAFRATGTPWAPWYIVPADKKWYRNVVVAQLLVEKLRALKLKYPKADPELLKKTSVGGPSEKRTGSDN
jgi:PPK2 family polyphosphate:nucleotide phosphotransferase